MQYVSVIEIFMGNCIPAILNSGIKIHTTRKDREFKMLLNKFKTSLNNLKAKQNTDYNGLVCNSKCTFLQDQETFSSSTLVVRC